MSSSQNNNKEKEIRSVGGASIITTGGDDNAEFTQHQPGVIFPSDNPGGATAASSSPPASPPPFSTPPEQVPPPALENPTELQLYLYDKDRQVLVPFRLDYATSIPFPGLPQAAGKIRVATPRSDKKLGVIIPLIKIPHNSADWMVLASTAQRHPYCEVLAVVNPSLDQRGIAGTASPSPEFANAIDYLINSGIRVIGYVSTNRRTKSLASTYAEIQRWIDWYPTVTGIYLDDSKNDLDQDGNDIPADAVMIDYYNNLDQFVKRAHKQRQGRHGYQQQVYDAMTILNISANKSPGAVMNKAFYDALFTRTNIDVITIYEQEGYPTDQNYAELKREWMGSFQRSRFAIVAYHASENDIEIRNFVDKATSIEKLAGYVYATTEWITNMNEATALSPLTATIMDQIDQLAIQDRIPAIRGAQPSSTAPDLSTPKNIDQITGMAPEEAAREQQASAAKYDKMGVRMIYPTAPEWKETSRIEWTAMPKLGGKVHELGNDLYETRKKEMPEVWLEVKSAKGENKFLNVEMSGYFRVIETGKQVGYLIRQYARSGKQSEEKPCDGYSYQGLLLKNGVMCAQKQLQYNAYTNTRGLTQATNKNLLERWFGMKTIIYNYNIFDTRANKMTDRQGVAIECWIDDNADDGQGNLVLKNDWRHVCTVRDEGGWFAAPYVKGKKQEEGFNEDLKCKGLQEYSIDNRRKRDEIINTHDDYVGWRWQDATVQFSHLSVREIRRVAAD